jgi:hypothetical protein
VVRERESEREKSVGAIVLRLLAGALAAAASSSAPPPAAVVPLAARCGKVLSSLYSHACARPHNNCAHGGAPCPRILGQRPWTETTQGPAGAHLNPLNVTKWAQLNLKSCFITKTCRRQGLLSSLLCFRCSPSTGDIKGPHLIHLPP